MKQKVLVLGANGFIGGNLIPALREVYEVIDFNRQVDSIEEVVSSKFPDFVINCSASKANAHAMNSFEANIEFQMACLKILLKQTKESFKWVQVASYYELQIPFGRTDNYSLDKQICRSILHRLEKDGFIKLTTIFLPHIFGKGENSNRVIPSIIRNLQNGQIAEISQGKQFLPILSVEDCCSAIIAAIQTDQLICSATPMWYDRVENLASIIQNAISKGVLQINTNNKSVDNSFLRVEFPPTVKNWISKMSINDFLSQLTFHDV